jgi:dipeptidyl aminopeptidase/acylaminoacyl peptidase
VPVGEAVQMQTALQERGIPVELILLEGEGHGAARRAGKAVFTGHTLRFLAQHLDDVTRR